MTGKSPKKEQRDLFRPMLEDFIDMNHESVLSANKIGRSYFEKEPGVYYSYKGAPSVPIRMMAGVHVAQAFVQFGR
jgi:IS5 family transposase